MAPEGQCAGAGCALQATLVPVHARHTHLLAKGHGGVALGAHARLVVEVPHPCAGPLHL
eukprot:CAMPEP_0177650180 /NCGR_PEP_ID=MMETSP0447-20121125/11795_1 /TAXON_ID=0 /ORGANISM="Stygamoeba regulata, Strain BSH-02190019" /LENGTH=58 /DNA_ID=CAMNT_0019153013 /DNA_START=297 /DNA_END=470 /DNA_ORIENTATION=+